MKRHATVLLSLLTAGPALAQPAPPAKPLADAFAAAVSACVRNVQGQLPFNPPSQALTDAGVVLADPAGASELAPFSDLNLQQRIFGAVPSTPGNIIIGSDPSQKLCRVVIVDATPVEIGPIYNTPAMTGNGWTVADGNPLEGWTLWKGTVMGSGPLTIKTQTPPDGTPGVGAAKYLYTLTNP